MARISGVDLPKNKRGEIGLTYIYGIGKSIAQRYWTMPISTETKSRRMER